MNTTITIIEQVSATEVIVQCARCKGTGRVWPNDSDSRPCWICNGRGTLLLQVERLPLVHCARCNGTGRKWPNDSDSQECQSCGGAGCQPVAGEMRIIN
jgi:DnaJ-class molecular chaperone